MDLIGMDFGVDAFLLISWFTLGGLSGFVSLIRGRYLWAFVGLSFPMLLLFGWIGDGVGAFFGYLTLASGFAVVGVVRPPTETSLLVRRGWPETAWTTARTLIVIGCVSVVVGAGVGFLVAFLDARAYEEALVAEPVGRTAITDFQFGPNFNTDEVWQVFGSVQFTHEYGEVPIPGPDDPYPPNPTHPKLVNGVPEHGIRTTLQYTVRLYFDQPHGLDGTHHIEAICRIQGHDSSGTPWNDIRVLDACRDLTIRSDT